MNDSRIRAELLKQVNSDSAIALEKVARYVTLTNTFASLDKAVKQMGAIVVTENGSQSFTKTNPAIDAMNKINSQLIALGKDMGLQSIPTPTPAVEEDTGGDML